LASFPIAKTSDITPGKMIGAQIDGEKILVANVDGQFYAMRAVCNHMGGALDKGKLENNVVTCPLHGSKWDVKTGKLVQFFRELSPEPVYKVSVVGDQIFVEK
jgi:nitrite reductase/ring-hydroxylating ferredoxin subunit